MKKLLYDFLEELVKKTLRDILRGKSGDFLDESLKKSWRRSCENWISGEISEKKSLEEYVVQDLCVILKEYMEKRNEGF